MRSGDWRDPVAAHDGDRPKGERRRWPGVDPSLPSLAAPVARSEHVRSRRVYPFCTYSIDFVRVWSIWSARIIGSSCRSCNRGVQSALRQDRGPRATGATRVLNTCLYLGFLADLADSAHRFSENIREFANSGRTTPAASTTFLINKIRVI